MILFLAWGLAVFGFLFMAIGVAGAALAVVGKTAKGVSTAPGGGADLGTILAKLTDAIKAFTDLVKTLATSPVWLVCTLFGFALEGGAFYFLKNA